MKIVFVSDAFHLHQKGVADALYQLTNKSYCFITTMPLREERKKMGFDNKYPSYVLDASSKDVNVLNKAQYIIDEADVVVLGSAPYTLLRNRLSKGKLTFRYSERILKAYKHYLKIPVYIFDNVRTRGCYLLCSSAFASHDYNLLGGFKNKCYKWGYFTEVENNINAKIISSEQQNLSKINLMWCSRFMKLKHSELPILLIKNLRDRGYDVHLDMYGEGTYKADAMDYVKMLGLNENISFIGNVSNDVLMAAMRTHEIFLFTSDRNEGWGAVANESMSNGCVLVASDHIGSVPYLVKDKENGCTFKSSSRCKGFGRFGVSVDHKSLDSLVDKVEWLINNPSERKRLSENAIKTMQETWNPRVAARNLLTLIEDIKQGRDTSIEYGPCSKA